MTIFFGTLLSFTRMQLGPIQKVQVEIDTKKKILGAVMEISSLTPEEILSLYDKIGLSLNSFSPNKYEEKILRKIFEWPKVIESASNKFEPHKIPFYLYAN